MKNGGSKVTGAIPKEIAFPYFLRKLGYSAIYHRSIVEAKAVFTVFCFPVVDSLGYFLLKQAFPYLKSFHKIAIRVNIMAEYAYLLALVARSSVASLPFTLK